MVRKIIRFLKHLWRCAVKVKEGHSSVLDWAPFIGACVVVFGPWVARIFSGEVNEGHKALAWLARNSEHISATGLCGFIVFMFWHSFCDYEEKKMALAKLRDSYFYSVSIEGIAIRDQGQSQNGKRRIAFVVGFQNSKDSPIKYQVTELSINGEKSPELNQGITTIIAASGKSSYLALRDIDFTNMGKNSHDFILNIGFSYGPISECLWKHFETASGTITMPIRHPLTIMKSNVKDEALKLSWSIPDTSAFEH